MTSDPKKRLEARGASQVDPIDANFADRLESGLRHQHMSERTSSRRRAGVLLPRLAFAGLLVVVGLVGAVALSRADDGVPIAVVDDGLLPPATQPHSDDEVSEPAIDATATGVPQASTAVPPVAVSSTAIPETRVPSAEEPVPVPPTVVPTVVTPTPTPTPTPQVAGGPAEPPPVATDPTATVEPSATPATVSPTATAVAPTATSTPVPTPTTPAPTATVVEVATAVPVPTPAVTPTPVEPTPTPVPIELTCGSRQSDAFVAVVCTWQDPGLDDLAQYELLRSLNGSDAAVVVRQRAGTPTNYIDRDVELGDVAVYLVAGLNSDDETRAASVRERVELPPN